MSRQIASKSDRKRLVAMWLERLAAMTAGLAPVPDLEKKIEALAPLLADNFQDDACFSQPALEAIARECKFLPAYAELHDKLTKWYHQSRQPPSRIPDDVATSGLPIDAQVWAKFWRLRVAENFAGGSKSAGVTLDLIRARAPEAYDWLVATDGDALGVARHRRWPLDATHERQAADAKAWLSDPQAVERAMRIIIDSQTETYRASGPWTQLRLMLRKHAPENLGLMSEYAPQIMPPAPPPAPTAPSPAPPPAATLTPEQVQAVRAQPSNWQPPWETSA